MDARPGGTRPQLGPRISISVKREVPRAPQHEPYSWGALTAGPDGAVLIGDGPTLSIIHATTGAVEVVNRDLDGTIYHVSVSPSGSLAYVSLTDGTPNGLQVVDEVDLSSGHILARTSAATISVADAPGRVTAVDGGVWLSWQPGMFGQTAFLRQSDLAVIEPPSDPGAINGFDDLFDSAGGQGTILADGALWVLTGTGELGCIDPTTGVVRGEERLASTTELLGVDSTGRVYLTYGNYVLVVSAPTSCFDDG